MKRRWIGITIFILLLASVTVVPWRSLLAQATAGYSKIGSTTTATTFTTTAFTGPLVYNFEVTATNAAGESGPSNIAQASIPAGSHTVTLTWTASAGATGYNVYDFLVQVPPAPAGLQVVIN